MLSAATEDAFKVNLAADVLHQFGSARICVQGSSMLPSIRPGDQIELHSTPLSEIKQGDIVAHRRDDRLFVHRVIGKDAAGQLLTRGDTLPQADASVSESELLGSVTGVFRGEKRVDHRATPAQRFAAKIFRRSRFCAALFIKFATL